VSINANVAPATHGETVREVLGGGDGTQAFQEFRLRQPPLTYVSASTPSGTASTLQVRVNDLLWKEVRTLFGHAPEERVYTTRADESGNTTVVFGDGTTGARLPSGQSNVQAIYRKGIGVGGLAPRDRLSQLLTRPLGLNGVTNPNPATGAADGQALEDARVNAPLAVRTLDRVVSLQDYEDFARSFSGISKSLATWTWFGNTQGIFVTVAGSEGAKVKNGSPLYINLVKAILDAGDSSIPLRVESYLPAPFSLSASLRIDPDYLPAKVVDAVTQKLRDSFSFAHREFGQPVMLSEVVAIIQNVEGVLSVNVTKLYRFDQTPGGNSPLMAAAPESGAVTAAGAELLLLSPHGIALEVLR
jgi:predicted phage baseplate assembly protein